MRGVLVLGVVSALAIAGCGGGTATVTQVKTQTGTLTPPPLTRAEYIAKADAICAEYQKTTDPLRTRINKAINQGQYAQAAKVVRQSLSAARAGYDQIKALPKPAGDAHVLDQIEKARDQSLVLVEILIDALHAEDVTKIDGLLQNQSDTLTTKANIETGYGFKVCGQNN